MRVLDVMKQPVQTISPAEPAGDAWDLMQGRRLHHLVVTEGSRVVGILSDRDVGGRRGGQVRKDRTVGELMSTHVVAVPPETTVRKAANLMRGRSIGCLVVADTKRTLGIITVADLLELIGRGTERPVASTSRRTLSHRAPHRKRHSSMGVW